MFAIGAYSVLRLFFWALGLAAFGIEAWALGDAIRRPAQAFVAAGKQTKQLWLIILGIAAAVGLFYAAYAIPAIGLLPVAGFVAAAVYLTDVRPKIKDFHGGRGGTSQGPYGPW